MRPRDDPVGLYLLCNDFYFIAQPTRTAEWFREAWPVGSELGIGPAGNHDTCRAVAMRK